MTFDQTKFDAKGIVVAGILDHLSFMFVFYLLLFSLILKPVVRIPTKKDVRYTNCHTSDTVQNAALQ
jgi:hypothetical protein